MAILTAVYTTAENSSIAVTYDDGRADAIVPDDLSNRDRAEIDAQPIAIAPFVPVPLTPEQQAKAEVNMLGVNPAYINIATFEANAYGDPTKQNDAKAIIDAAAVNHGLTPAQVINVL